MDLNIYLVRERKRDKKGNKIVSEICSKLNKKDYECIIQLIHAEWTLFRKVGQKDGFRCLKVTFKDGKLN